jgi:hypothetical protein
MKKRTFYLTSILLGLLALCLHLGARDQLVASQHLKAECISNAMRDHISYSPDPRSVELNERHRILNDIGLVFAFSCLAALVMALLLRESGWYSIPVGLLISDFIVQMLLI